MTSPPDPNPDPAPPSRRRDPMAPRTARRKRTVLWSSLLVLATLGILGAGLASAHGWGRGASNDARNALCQPGRLNVTANDVAGDCIRFTTDAAAGTLRDVTATVNGTQVVLLSSLKVDALADATAQVRRDYVLSTDDARLVARDAPALEVMSRNSTIATLVFPAEAAITVHQAVSDWSPAGATITYAGLKENLVLPKDAVLTQDGQTLTVSFTGALRFAPAGLGDHGFGGFGPGHGGPHGMDGMRGQRDGQGQPFDGSGPMGPGHGRGPDGQAAPDDQQPDAPSSSDAPAA